MKVTRIDLADEEPAMVAVEMTTDEAVFITEVAGRMNGIEQNEVMPKGDAIGSEIYDALVGSFFNRFWDGGHPEALLERRRS